MINLFSKKNIIGLTGMSGAGKTTACNYFAQEGFLVINCDKIAFDVVKVGKRCYNDVTRYFGEGILLDDGSLNRRKIADIIFTDARKKVEYEGIIYPYIAYEIINVISCASDNPEVLIDGPTLFESGFDDLCHTVVSVISDRDMIVERIVHRDGISVEAATNRISAQHTEDFFREKSQYIITNNGDFSGFSEQIKNTIKSIRRDYAKTREN